MSSFLLSGVVSASQLHDYDPAGFAYDYPGDMAHGPDFDPAAIDTRGSSERNSAASGSGSSGRIYDAGRSFVAPSQLAGAACSFSGSTAVLMADGSAKPIAEIEIGDFVLAEDPETGERGARKVTRLWVHEDQITDLELDDGSRVSTTEDHPFWSYSDREWQRADALDPGDLLLSADGGLLAVDGMDPASTRTTTAYNLTVDDIHTYFVRIGTEDILVHNNNGLCDLAGRPFLRDFATKNTINRSANYASEGHARAVARTKLGANPVDIGNNKLRSANGVWQYRAKPVDTSLNHVHLERLNPATGEVLQNWHFYWPGGG